MARTKQQPAKGGKQAVARNSAKRKDDAAKPVSTRRDKADHLKGVKLNYDIQKLKHDLKWRNQRYNLKDVVAAAALTGMLFGMIYSGLFIAYLIAG